QFWSTARIETTEEGTQILATVDGVLRTVSESSLRRNLKLQDEEGISSLPDTELFENLTLMGYNISPNQKFTFRKAPRVTFPAAVEGSMQQNINELTALCTSLQRKHSELLVQFQAQKVEINKLNARDKILEDHQGVIGARSIDDVPIKGKRIDEEEGGIDVPTSSYSIPTAGPPVVDIHTGRDAVPTASPIVATATVVPPYSRRKGKEVMIAKDAEVVRFHAEEELQGMIDSLDRTNETIAKYLQEYQDFALELPLERRIELIIADEPASPMRDVNEGEACPTNSGFIADQDRVTIAKFSTLPHDTALRVTFPAAVEGSMQQTINELTALCTSLQRKHSELLVQFQAQKVEINKLNARVKILEDHQGVIGARSIDDVPIKGKRIYEEEGITGRVSSDTEEIRMDEGEVAVERTSEDTEEMATVLTSMDAATVLVGGIDIPTSSYSIPTAGPPVVDIHTGRDAVPTASPIVATATVVPPYSRRKGKEVMIARDTEVVRFHAEEELQGMIDSLDRTNETIDKYLQEYQDFALELPMERRIELISDLRVRDSGYLADVEVGPKEASLRDDVIARGSDEPHLEQDIDPEIQAEIDECFAYADALRYRRIDDRVVVKAVDQDKNETGV
nr:hypothetical protein [Tanacetum cinerariifolium]